MGILSNPKSIEFQGIWKESIMRKQKTFWSSMVRQLGTKSILRGSKSHARRLKESALSHKQIRLLQKWSNKRKWGTHPRGADTLSLIVFTKMLREGRRGKSLYTVPALSQSVPSSRTLRRQSSSTLSKPQWQALSMIKAKFSRDFLTVWVTARTDQGCWSKTQMASQMTFSILKQGRSFSSQELVEPQFTKSGPKILAFSFIKRHLDPVREKWSRRNRPISNKSRWLLEMLLRIEPIKLLRNKKLKTLFRFFRCLIRMVMGRSQRIELILLHLSQSFFKC